MQSFDVLRPGYSDLLDAMKIDANNTTLINVVAKRCVANKLVYLQVQTKTTVPWEVVAVIHEREASGNFRCHLHNGDPLSARTVHVPKGRPKEGNPPFSWIDSACDALALDKLTEVKDWTLEHACYMLELYNGFGYRSHHINTPYLWALSSNYRSGKYVADSQFDPNAVDHQIGTIPLIARIAALDPSSTLARCTQAPSIVPSQTPAAPLAPVASLSAHTQAAHPEATPHPGSWGAMWQRASEWLAAPANA